MAITPPISPISNCFWDTADSTKLLKAGDLEASDGVFLGRNAGQSNTSNDVFEVSHGTTATEKSIRVVGGQCELFGTITAPQKVAPSDPASGKFVLWMDSTSGDLMVKINFGGTVKTATLADFSAL